MVQAPDPEATRDSTEIAPKPGSPSELGGGELARLGPSRRLMLRATAAAVAAPYIVPSTVFGASAPSNQITVGCIGVGNQGQWILRQFLDQEGCRVVAVCDVNRGSGGYKNPEQFLGRQPAKAFVDRHYGESQSAGAVAGCTAYSDFRELLDRQDIDAVTVVTPDHWHAVMTVMACEAGKDVYCEKPLGLTVADQRAMVDAVRRNDRILQTGSQERSNPSSRRACELVRNGYIGEVRRVVTHVGRHNKVGPGPGWQAEPVPDGFDYDAWLGPAPFAPYHSARCLYRFRFIEDYSGGQTTNFGAHSMDLAQWGMGRDGDGPVEVEHLYADYLPEGSLYDVPTHMAFQVRYEDGVELVCQTSHPAVRCFFEGTEGVLRVDAAGRNFQTSPASIKEISLGPDDVRLGDSVDHVADFIDAVKQRREPAAPVEAGHSSGTICHLGNIATKLAANLSWNPAEERFVGSRSDEANRLLARERRSPWDRLAPA